MPTTTLCVDAGIVIRYVAYPDDVHIQQVWEAWQQQGLQIYAPGLLFYEVTNVLHRFYRHGLMQTEAAEAVLQAALALPIERIDDAGLHLRARALAQRFQLPAAYDAHYLALAERLDADLWTTDERLFNRVQADKINWVKLFK